MTENDKENLITDPVTGADEAYENKLRPQALDEFTGQDKLKENLKIFIQSAKKRGETLDHCLFYSLPALEKPRWPT